MQGKKRKASDGSPSEIKVAGLEKEDDEEVSSGSREKATQDIAFDTQVGIGTPKKRPRATELQKLQIGTQSPQMPRKLRPKQHVDDGGKPKSKKGDDVVKPKPKKGAAKCPKVQCF